MLASSRYRTRLCSQPCCHVNAGVSVPDPLEARRGVGGRRSTDGEVRPARIGSVGVAWARASSVVRRDVLSPGVADTSLAASDGRGCARIQPEAAGVMTRRVAWRVEANEASGGGRLGAPRAAPRGASVCDGQRFAVPRTASFILPRCYAYYACIPYSTSLLSTHSSCSRSAQQAHATSKPKVSSIVSDTRPNSNYTPVGRSRPRAPAPSRTAPSTLRLLLYVIQRWAAWSLLFT